ncbi:MAG: hypothetical protein SFX73_17110 [Kofleriaceae bacterium]|nr:hypothetical protein [Kofleriaceae bacterium]
MADIDWTRVFETLTADTERGDLAWETDPKPRSGKQVGPTYWARYKNFRVLLYIEARQVSYDGDHFETIEDVATDVENTENGAVYRVPYSPASIWLHDRATRSAAQVPAFASMVLATKSL